MTGLRARLNLRTDWAWLAGICLFAILLRIPIAGIPLERDEGEYAYVAQRWIQGDIPYRNLFDQKLPGTFFTYALIERGFGTTPSAIHWAAQIYTLGTLAVMFLLGRRLSSPASGLAAAALTAFMTTDPSVLGNAANTEVFMLLPLSAAMLALCYAIESDALWWACATGALGAAAVIFKQVALPNLVFSALAVAALSRRRAGSVAGLLLGVGCVALPVLLYFVSLGAWDALYYDTVTHNLHYQQRLSLASYPHAFWLQSQAPLRSFWPILLLAAVPIVFALFRRPRNEPCPARGTIRRNTLLGLAWLVASFAGTASGGYFRPHYYIQLIPPIALLGGLAVSVLARGRFRQAIGVGLAGGAIAIGVLSNLWYYAPGDTSAKSLHLYANPVFVQASAIGSLIAKHSHPHDSVFVLGSDAEILYYAGRPSATRYIVVDPLMGPFPDVRQRQVETLSEVRRNDPRFIVTVFLPSSFAAVPETPADIFDGTREMLSHSYRLAAVLGVTDSVVPLVSGQQAEEAWLISPVWYGAPSWCALAVWERVQQSPGADRAAAEAENALGLGLVGHGDSDGAVAHYREAIRLDPDFAAPHNNLAAALANSGQTNDAIEQYVEAVRLSPLNPQPHWNLAVLLQDGGRLGEAIEQFRAAVQLNPRMVEMRYRLATTYAQAGQIREAEGELGEVLRARPEWSAAEAALAWLLATADDAQLRDGARAVQLAEDAAQRTQRRDANVLNSLAAAYAEVGRYAEAAAVAAQAIEIAPSSGQAAMHNALAARIAQYRAGHPVRERPGAPQP